MKMIKIEVEEKGEKELYLKQHLGDGTLGKTKFEASLRLPDMSLLISVGKKTYLVQSQKVIQAVIEMHEKK